MNHQINNLFRLCAIGFAVLISFTAYWQIWAADSLAVRQDNARLVYRQLQIKRGLIFAGNGRTVLAENRQSKQDGQTIYTRKYPFRGLFAQAVGYNSVNQGRTGLELSYNDFLTSSNANLSTQLQNLGDSLRGRTITGDNVITSLSLPAQRAAMDGLGQMHGAVVAIQPSTGRVIAMASTPTFNPNRVVANYAKLTRPNSGAPLLNRTTQGLYTPGSTFKTVTSTAALKSHLYTPTSPLTPAPACIKVFVQLCNAGLESFPPIDLSYALTQSVNTVFAQVGQKIGSQRLRNAMSEFGFFTDPTIDLPGDEVVPSGLYRNGHQISQSAPIDVARTAIGQGNLAVTPLQMAEVAATIANGGVRMQPSLVDKAVTPGGSTVYQHHPQAIQRVMSNQTAQEMTGMMQKVVDEGTGTEAQIGNLPVAGKTGTAEIGPPGSSIYTSWFIAFAPGAPGDTPKIAVAVVIDRTTEFGGQVAAPIAADVIRAYLGPNVAQ